MQQQAKKQPQEDVAAADAMPDTTATTEKGEALKASLDDLLDEIDDVLEQNAEAFVKGYVQRGGE